MRWRAPEGGPAPTGFVLAGGTAPGETLASVPLDGGFRLASFPLPPGTFYLRLYTQAGGVTSVASNEARVPVDIPAAPSPPAALLGLADGSTLALSWARTFAGGVPTGAVLDVSGAASLSLPLGATDTFAFAGVPSGSYTFNVRAANAFGLSDPSNAVTLTFPALCSGPPLTPPPLFVHRAGQTLQVFWDAPASGPAPTGYVLLVSGAFAGAFPLTARSIGGTVGPGSYGFRVVATNPCGQSEPTALESVTVP